MRNWKKKLFTKVLAVFLIFPWMGLVSAETVTYYHHDILGTPLAVTDESGDVVWWANYYPYGSKHDGNSSDTKPQRFTGKEFDEELGLYYFGARYYNPTIARFISVDPEKGKEKIPLSWNRYSYAFNNPLKYYDPFGRDTYEVNRELGGDEAKRVYNPLTHTFVLTTEDGEVESTYGWSGAGHQGMEKFIGEWQNPNLPDDVKAAKEALKKGWVKKVGGEELDKYVDKAYKEKKEDPKSRHLWTPLNTCKHEARSLIKEAIKKWEQERGIKWEHRTGKMDKKNDEK